MVALDLSKQIFMRHVRRFRSSGLANDHDDIGDLLPDEQSELAVKLRFGIHLEELMPAHEAAEIRQRPVLSALVPKGAQLPANPTRPPRPDAEIRSRAAALGLSAGSRGQWLRR